MSDTVVFIGLFCLFFLLIFSYDFEQYINYFGVLGDGCSTTETSTVVVHSVMQAFNRQYRL